MPTGQTLDPFGTSMRTLSTQASEWLPLFRAGNTLPGERRQEQALTDLRGARLVDPNTEQLTAFGMDVLRRWEKLDIQRTFGYELPCAIALIDTALQWRIGDYLERLAFWWDIRTLFGEDFLEDEETLLLVPYLNQTRAGFNPWAALYGMRLQIEGPYDWDELKHAIPDRDLHTDNAIDRLSRNTTDRRPVAARIVFCRAMDLIFRSQFDTQEATDLLDGLVLPARGER